MKSFVKKLFGYCYYWAVYYFVMAISYIWIRVAPWWLARFNASWVEYQRGPVYRQRLVSLGFGPATRLFINSQLERRYCLKLRFQKEPWLRWKILFMPFSFPVPDELIIAYQEGCLEP